MAGTAPELATIQVKHFFIAFYYQLAGTLASLGNLRNPTTYGKKGVIYKW
jgi:hypothetical protein